MPTFLTLHEILAALKISKSKLYQDIRNGSFPAPIKLGKSSRWDEEAVKQALAALAAK